MTHPLVGPMAITNTRILAVDDQAVTFIADLLNPYRSLSLTENRAGCLALCPDRAQPAYSLLVTGSYSPPKPLNS